MKVPLPFPFPFFCSSFIFASSSIFSFLQSGTRSLATCGKKQRALKSFFHWMPSVLYQLIDSSFFLHHLKYSFSLHGLKHWLQLWFRLLSTLKAWKGVWWGFCAVFMVLECSISFFLVSNVFSWILKQKVSFPHSSCNCRVSFSWIPWRIFF